MRGNSAQEYRTSRISPKNSTRERRGDEWHKRTGRQPCIFPKNLILESADGGRRGVKRPLPRADEH
jgi:hypothetical protein